MKEELNKEKEYDLEESEKKDFDKEIKNEEQKDEIKENKKEILINLKENIDLQHLEDGNFNNKKFNYFLYIIPEVIFTFCFLLGIFYKKFYNIFLFITYFMPILISNCSFFINKNLLYLNNYLLLSKLVSIEILFFYPIFIIYESYNYNKDLAFIIIFILGFISGIFSLIYLFIYFYIFQFGLFQFKKIYFLYLELTAIFLMHPFLIYTYYMDMTGSTGMISTSIEMLLEMITISVFESILFAMNCCLLYCKAESGNPTFKYIITIIKILLYILVEFILSQLYTARVLKKEFFISFFIRMLFMVSSLFFSFIIKNS